DSKWFAFGKRPGRRLLRKPQAEPFRCGRVGVWVERPDKPKTITGQTAEDKIAAIGIRLRKWVSFHGISINVEPDLSHFDGIVPCGITEFGVTSLVDLGLPVTMADLDLALERQFTAMFGDTPVKKDSVEA
ncbi:MAG: hypothetical protein VX181_05500, partial [Pseudomonadota bacterium]|nr:hypothetical protein [Pseudomonadota bacterium]